MSKEIGDLLNISVKTVEFHRACLMAALEVHTVYTNDAGTLGQRLATDVTKSAALDFTPNAEQQSSPQLSKEPRTVQVHEYNHPDSRLAAVATDYAARPEKSVIIASNKAEREELTQLARADLYAQGKLGREAIAVPVLVEKKDESRYRVEAYEPGDKIHYRQGSSIEHIPHDSQATVVATRPKGNLLTVQIDTTKDEVTYSPSQLRQQTRESRLFREEVREIAEGERIRFTASDRETRVRLGDLGTVTRIGRDRSMSVQLDSGKTAELAPEKTLRIDYGYAVEAPMVFAQIASLRPATTSRGRRSRRTFRKQTLPCIPAVSLPRLSLFQSRAKPSHQPSPNSKRRFSSMTTV